MVRARRELSYAPTRVYTRDNPVPCHHHAMCATGKEGLYVHHHPHYHHRHPPPALRRRRLLVSGPTLIR